MGVSGLQSFVKRRVPNGKIDIDIKDEIRKYYATFSTPNPPPPIIVVDLKCMVFPFLYLDRSGVLCGGRFNDITRHMDRFFGELKSLGVQLEFFSDGPVRNATSEKWCQRKDNYYQERHKLFEAVDNGEEISLIRIRLPFHYIGVLKEAAARHGGFHWAITSECDQEMAAFAKQSKALAIMTDDSDFLIYEGSFRYWNVGDINIANLTLTEFDRNALLRCLGLSSWQMPLLATLVGNDVVDSRALSRFHHTLGRMQDTILNVSRFVTSQKNQSSNTILSRVLELCSDRRMLMGCFKKSLNSYQLNYKPFNLQSAKDPVETILLSSKHAFIYQMWHAQPIECSPGIIDLREAQLGRQVVQLKITLMLRMGGIILYQRQMQRRMVDYSECKLMIKLQHDIPHEIHFRRVEFPTHIKPPPIQQLLSSDSELCSEIHDEKLQLLSWVVANKLDHRQIETIPELLQITVLTLFCLIENRILELFEADLLLKVAYDVAFDKYDPEAVTYPPKLASRPFRVAFVFQQVYGQVATAFKLMGVSGSFGEYPPFDGVLFHNWYDKWKDRRLDADAELDEIRKMRIYTSIREETEG